MSRVFFQNRNPAVTRTAVLASGAVKISKAAALTARKLVKITNNGPNTIYVLPASISAAPTTATGYPVPAGIEREFAWGTEVGDIYARAATADQASPADTACLESE